MFNDEHKTIIQQSMPLGPCKMLEDPGNIHNYLF